MTLAVQSFIDSSVISSPTVYDVAAYDPANKRICLGSSSSAGFQTFNIGSGLQTNAVVTVFPGGDTQTLVQAPYAFDGANIYWFSSNGTFGDLGVIRKLSISTLALVASFGTYSSSGGNNGFPPPNTLVCQSVNGSNFLIGSRSESSPVTILNTDAMQWAGFSSNLTEPNSYAVAGASVGNATGYAYCVGQPASSTGTWGIYTIAIAPAAGGYTVPPGSPVYGSPSPHITLTRTGGITPAQIDAAWTHITGSAGGAAFDASDGNLLLWFSTTDSVANQNYIVKVNPLTATILWASPVAAIPITGGFETNANTKYVIKNGTVAWVTVSGTGDLITVNTKTGAVTTTAIAGFSLFASGLTGGQFSDDSAAYPGIFIYSNYNSATMGAPTPLNSTGSSWSGAWSELSGMIPAPPAIPDYYVERLTQLFDENVPDNEHFCVDSGIVPPSARLATASADGFDGIRCYGMDLLTDLGATTVAGVLGGMDIGDSRAASAGVVDFAFGGGFTLAYVQSFGAVTTPAVMLDQYQVAIDSGTTDSSSHRLYYVIPFMVGFPYTSQGQLLRPNHGADAGTREGPAMGKIRRNHRYAALLYRTQGDLQFGSDFGATLHPAPLRQADGVTALAQPALFSGTIRDTLADDYSTDGMIAFQQTRPAPATIVSVAGMIETQDE